MTGRWKQWTASPRVDDMTRKGGSTMTVSDLSHHKNGAIAPLPAMSRSQGRGEIVWVRQLDKRLLIPGLGNIPAQDITSRNGVIS